MKVSETLNKAADLIEERGWVAGVGGWPESLEPRPLCLEGGIMAAQGLTAGTGEEGILTLWETCPAYAAVRDYLGGLRPYSYNDAPERTAGEVIEALRACAVIESAREEQDEAFATYAENIAVSA